jgi:beta-N-acetylhexosaminidase
MPLTLDQAVGQKLMLGFYGAQPPAEILETLQQQHIGGITLFRSLNLHDVAQIHDLTAALQRAAQVAGQPPLLIGGDQEGGTLMAVPGTTRFPGNLALGATRSPEPARRAGYALRRELAALGFNLNYPKRSACSTIALTK